MSRTPTKTRSGRSRPGRSRPVQRRVPAPAPVATPVGRTLRLPDGTRSVGSPWVWRGMFMLSLVAIGLCLSLAVGRHTTYAILWGVIATGWFAISMVLWRKTVVAER